MAVKHPEKSKRPLASGVISKSTAVVVFIGLLVLNSVLLFFGDHYFQGNFWKFTVIIVFYIIMNIAYTFKLKHVAIIDVSIIAIGFVLRVLAGGYATGIYISQWAILLTFVLSLVLAIGKRRGEGAVNGNKSTAVLGKFIAVGLEKWATCEE